MRIVLALLFVAALSLPLVKAGCDDAIIAVYDIYDGCPIPFFSDIENEAALDAFCTEGNDCSAYAYLDALDIAINECGVSFLEYFLDDIMGSILDTINLACLQIDGKYCSEVMYELLMSGIDYPVTEGQLENYCHPCVPYYWSMLASYSDETDNYYDTVGVCMKDGDTWCALELQKLLTIEDDNYLAMTEIACSSSCIMRYFQLNEYFKGTTYDSLFDVLCYQDDEGNFCLPIVVDELESTLLISRCASGALTTDCEAALNSFVENTGCCYESLFNFYPDDDFIDQMTYLMNITGIEIPEICGAIEIPQLTLQIDNLDYEYALDEWESIAAWLETDFSLNTGIPTDAIYSELLSETEDGVSVLLQGLTVSNITTSITVQSLFNIIANQGYALYETCSEIDDESRIDPITALTVNFDDSIVEKIDASLFGSSGTAAVSVVALVISMLVLLM